MNATRNLEGEILMTDENIADFLGDEKNYLMVDMGQIDEEDMPFMIIDKDTGNMYDMRNDRHVERLTDVATTRFGTQQSPAVAGFGGGDEKEPRKSAKGTAWSGWWREKKKSNQEYLWAAEVGDLGKLKKHLSKDEMKDMVADLNAKGLDQWSALHFACDSGHLQIVQELLKQPKIDVEALSTMDRTPLH